MARDSRIERTRRTPEPERKDRELTTVERIYLLVPDVLNKVSQQLEDKQAPVQKRRHR